MTRDPLAFNYANEIRHTMTDGIAIEADLFERGDRQWSWSARITPVVVVWDEDGCASDAAGKPIKAGPCTVETEEIARTMATEWIRQTLRKLAGGAS